MTENPQQPREYDAVLGNQTPAPVDGLVLGGVKGVKQQNNKLSFAPGVDYTRLQKLLVDRKWQEADRETAAVMLRISCREKEGWLEASDIEKFSCEDLDIIDTLWRQHSDGRFSFSVQTQLWQSIDGTSSPNWETWCRFGETVGWYSQDSWLWWNDLTFNLSAPVGHLPRGGAFMGWGLGDFWTGCRMLSAIASRLANCNVPKNPNQPRKDDLVLGGQNSTSSSKLVKGRQKRVKSRLASSDKDVVLGIQNSAPSGSLILGGLEGVKSRLASSDVEARVAALTEALKYGEAGLDLVIQAWQCESGKVKWAAYSLLHHREEAKVKQVLQEYNPWLKLTCLHTLQQDSTIKSIAISGDGKILFSGREIIKVWDLQTQQLQSTSMSHYNINSLVISPDSKTLVSRGGDYDGDHIIKVWDLQTGQCQRTLDEHAYRVFSLAMSSDGKTLACGSESSGINVWDLQTGQITPTRTISGHSHYLVQALALSADGKTLISGSNDKAVKAWNFETGELIHTFRKHSDGIESVAISPDGQTIVSGSKDKTVKVWNLQTKKLQFTLEGHSGWVYCVVISPDGNTIISSGRDRTIRVWNLQTGECQRILKGHTDWVYCLAISPDGNTLVSGSRDNTIKVWGI